MKRFLPLVTLLTFLTAVGYATGAGYNNSSTAASNTSLNGIDIQGSASAANIDNALRELAAQIKQMQLDMAGVNTVGGTADAITISPAGGALTAYYDGFEIGFRSGGDTTITGPTANISSLGAKTIKKAVAGVETALAVGDIQSGGTYRLIYRSAWASAAGAFQLVNLNSDVLASDISVTGDVTTGDDVIVGDDIALASGGVINWASSDLLLTHSTDFLLGTGGQWQFQFTTATLPPIIGKNTADNASVITGISEGDRATPTDGDAAYYDWRLSDSGGVQTTFARQTTTASDVTDTTEDGKVEWSVMANGTLTEVVEFDGSGFQLNKGSFARGVPVTKTSDFSVGGDENWIIINKASQATVTLPAAASYPGREIMMKSITANGAISASSNVVPGDSATAGTAMIGTTDGAWGVFVSDGTNWIKMMQGN
jgi:hypothetical protein